MVINILKEIGFNMSFRDVLKEIQQIKEEMVSGDIASVETKLGSKPIRHQGKKSKKCKTHKRYNCLECLEEKE